ISATDAATTLSNFVFRYLSVLNNAQQLYQFQEAQRDIVIVPEPINNALLISATPRYMDDIARVISQIDVPQAQVVIQVLVAEVDLINNEEFGVEIGLQSPVLFQRSVVPIAFGSSGNVTYNGNPTAGTGLGAQVVNNGVTV